MFSDSANAQFVACGGEVLDDFFTATAICTNISDAAERAECTSEARNDSKEGNLLCREQRDARRELCAELGEARYEPDWDPALRRRLFEPHHPNPYFPLGIGHQWEYESEDETVAIEVLDATKLIDGVTCIVVNDRVEVDGESSRTPTTGSGSARTARSTTAARARGTSRASKATIRRSGARRDRRLLEGGPRRRPFGHPLPGDAGRGQVYRQEWSASNAEDAARVLSTSFGCGGDPELDEFVPEALAELLCAADDCIVTGEFSPLSPGSFERKYYARGIGLFLEVHPDSVRSCSW